MAESRVRTLRPRKRETGPSIEIDMTDVTRSEGFQKYTTMTAAGAVTVERSMKHPPKLWDNAGALLDFDYSGVTVAVMVGHFQSRNYFTVFSPAPSFLYGAGECGRYGMPVPEGCRTTVALSFETLERMRDDGEMKIDEDFMEWRLSSNMHVQIITKKKRLISSNSIFFVAVIDIEPEALD